MQEKLLASARMLLLRPHDLDAKECQALCHVVSNGKHQVPNHTRRAPLALVNCGQKHGIAGRFYDIQTERAPPALASMGHVEACKILRELYDGASRRMQTHLVRRAAKAPWGWHSDQTAHHPPPKNPCMHTRPALPYHSYTYARQQCRSCHSYGQVQQ